MAYDRDKALAYAHRWAHGRNPAYYNFDSDGGDCTNFISQCLYAGCGVMNYTKDTGWYYRSASDRAAAWTGVEYLYTFLLSHADRGPYASDTAFSAAVPGDIVQLSFDGTVYAHSLFVVAVPARSGELLVATHTYDSDYRPLGSYHYAARRLLHIEGVKG